MERYRRQLAAYQASQEQRRSSTLPFGVPPPPPAVRPSSWGWRSPGSSPRGTMSALLRLGGGLDAGAGSTSPLGGRAGSPYGRAGSPFGGRAGSTLSSAARAGSPLAAVSAAGGGSDDFRGWSAADYLRPAAPHLPRPSVLHPAAEYAFGAAPPPSPGSGLSVAAPEWRPSGSGALSAAGSGERRLDATAPAFVPGGGGSVLTAAPPGGGAAATAEGSDKQQWHEAAEGASEVAAEFHLAEEAVEGGVEVAAPYEDAEVAAGAAASEKAAPSLRLNPAAAEWTPAPSAASMPSSFALIIEAPGMLAQAAVEAGEAAAVTPAPLTPGAADLLPSEAASAVARLEVAAPQAPHAVTSVGVLADARAKEPVPPSAPPAPAVLSGGGTVQGARGPVSQHARPELVSTSTQTELPAVVGERRQTGGPAATVQAGTQTEAPAGAQTARLPLPALAPGCAACGKTEDEGGVSLARCGSCMCARYWCVRQWRDLQWCG